MEEERERCIVFRGGRWRGAAIRAETSVPDECAVSHAAFRLFSLFLSPPAIKLGNITGVICPVGASGCEFARR